MSITEKQMEEQYLKRVYTKLLETKEELEELLDNAKQDGIQSLQGMTSDVSLNFENITDNLDTFAVLEMKNREIDQMNIRLQTATTLLEKVKRLLMTPYFGKITVDFLDDEELEDFYIGINNFADESSNNLIYDWRSPIAELFYNNTIGPSSYSVHDNTIDVAIENRRQFILEKDQLIKFFDTSIAIQDDVLLEALEQDSTNEMKDITSTIQQEQNVIIRDTKNKNILVNGIAGSGKTSTIMQRIAYLLYLYRQTITVDNILILSPNRKFIEYISNVLPSLGERNPLNLTMLQFVERISAVEIENEQVYFQRISGEAHNKNADILRSKEYVAHIKQSDDLFLSTDAFLKDLNRKGKTIISKEKIAEIYHATPDYPKLIDKIQATKKQLSSYWEGRLLKQAKSTEIQNQILSLSEEMQQKYFGEIISEETENKLYFYGKKLLRKRYRSITKGIEENAWLDASFFFDKIFEAYEGHPYNFTHNDSYTLDEAVVLQTIQHNLIEKIEVEPMRFILIDEVQDYTPAQLSLLFDLFEKSAFTMVGDENQAIFNSSISFDSIKEAFGERGLSVQRYDLLYSYRSSGSITKVFSKLATDNKKMDIIPIRKDGAEPVFQQFDSLSDFVELLKENVQQLDGADSKLTVITKNEAEVETIKTALTDSELDSLKVTILPISLSKGLEFDHVLLYDVSAENYATDREIKILYTAISRAMKQLFVTYRKELPMLLR
ncbi:UvrD-helicase domain-containing protein [Enterococcus avium]|uniref:HelD family protein n=1 Tax=Enterococcus TaxID=1350 RepID=UPI002890F53F|nr:UvrD-helicase domain-containing protein [Enterococcus dongliensis]MDT2677877.1 UvrD-helicase domain-containing protein [Enterococcus dongliensis]GMS49842.1 AAA family ATPase [Enterococcus gallinarum]GMS52989.1 AAA family ATPase [Enterococcus gallinarum]